MVVPQSPCFQFVPKYHAIENFRTSTRDCFSPFKVAGRRQQCVTPNSPLRKKSVSFSDPLEEVFIVESFKKAKRNSSIEIGVPMRRRHRFERLFVNIHR